MGLALRPIRVLKTNLDIDLLALLSPSEIGEVPQEKGPSKFLYKDQNGYGHWINFVPYNGSSIEYEDSTLTLLSPLCDI